MNSKSAHRPAALAATLVLSLLASVPGVAVEIALDERQGLSDDLHTCGVHITGSDTLVLFAGIGVAEGESDVEIDSSEWVDFDFDSPQTGVEFRVIGVTDHDSDGIFGRALVEAFDAAGDSLGFQLISGIGIKDLAALFGPSAMSRVRVTALADGIQIGHVGYAETGPVRADLLHGGVLDYQNVPEPTVCGIRVVASGQSYYADVEGGGVGGLSVVGNDSLLLDASEWLRFEFPYPVDELVIDSLLFSLDGDLLYGEAVLFAYDESGGVLGSMSIPRHSLFGGPLSQSLDVAASLGVGGIAEVEIYSMGDGRRIEGVTYAPEPTHGGAALLVALAAAARRRLRASD